MKAKAETGRTVAQVRINKGQYSGFDARVTLPRVIVLRGNNLDNLTARMKALLAALDEFNVVREK